MFRNVLVQATLGIILQFVGRLGDEYKTGGTSPGIGCLPGIHNTREADLAAPVSFLDAGRSWTLRRIRSGEASIKDHYFLTCYLRHVSALKQGLDEHALEESVVAGAAETAEVCLRELKFIAEVQELLLGMPLEEGSGEASRSENTTLLASGLNLSDLSDPSVNAMDMDWIGDWPLDDFPGFSNFSWGPT